MHDNHAGTILLGIVRFLFGLRAIAQPPDFYIFGILK